MTMPWNRAATGRILMWVVLAAGCLFAQGEDSPRYGVTKARRTPAGAPSEGYRLSIRLAGEHDTSTIEASLRNVSSDPLCFSESALEEQVKLTVTTEDGSEVEPTDRERLIDERFGKRPDGPVIGGRRIVHNVKPGEEFVFSIDVSSRFRLKNDVVYLVTAVTTVPKHDRPPQWINTVSITSNILDFPTHTSAK